MNEQESRATAMVVGGSSGIGKEVARRMVQDGLELILVARDRRKLETAKAELGGNVEGMSAGLDGGKSVDEFIKSLKGKSRHIKHLVNAAGYFHPTPFLDHTKADFDRYHQLNRSFFSLTQAVVRNMMKHGYGSIVNIGSMWAK